jgi:hypothetical protein
MKVFHCDHCGGLVFFENTHCMNCGHLLAFLPDLMVVGSLDASDDSEEFWTSPLPAARGHTYHLCANYRDAQVCNWSVDARDGRSLCRSCRLTKVIPDLGVQGNQRAWYRLEAAKRRLLYTLLTLQLPIEGADAGTSLAFEFLSDTGAQSHVLTGHANGTITVSIAEADDAERERRRTQLGEPYRTLLGHMRHEIGHYYWTVLVQADPERLSRFRQLFGEDAVDYADALKQHYQNGPPADWQDRFITGYASAHAWEDWAETWAHYLHMSDTLETTAACGVSIRPRRSDEPALARVPAGAAKPKTSFDSLLESWFAITYLLNNLNRGLGLADAYPFVLSAMVVEKLRFVHETITFR